MPAMSVPHPCKNNEETTLEKNREKKTKKQLNNMYLLDFSMTPKDDSDIYNNRDIE